MPKADHPLANADLRLGTSLAVNRRRQEASRWAGLRPTLFSKAIHILPTFSLTKLVLQACGWWSTAYAQYLDVQVVRNELRHPDLPPALDGFRVLQLSDLHADLDPVLIDRLVVLLPTLDYDLAVLTGDYRDGTRGPFERAVQATARVVAALRPPVYGVLGNHDFLDMVEGLEASGLRLLLNEGVALPLGGAVLGLGGVDDPTRYATHDVAAAIAGLKSADFRLLLSHGADCHEEAAAAGFQAMLCGHTHGGQICLPNGQALLRHDEKLKAGMFAGGWMYRGITGYTSRGTGAVEIPARLHCPAEVTIHRLTRIRSHDRT